MERKYKLKFVWDGKDIEFNFLFTKEERETLTKVSDAAEAEGCNFELYQFIEDDEWGPDRWSKLTNRITI